jgi:LEA14-like dessication related protein
LFGLPGALFLGLCLCCATAAPPPVVEAPVPPEKPLVRLSFDRILGADPGHITLFFNLEIENSGSAGARPALLAWQFRLNGFELPEGAALVFEDPGHPLDPGARALLPVRLELDMEKTASSGDQSPAWSGAGEYRAELNLDLRFDFSSGGSTELRAGMETVFLRVLEPQFSITSIAVRKAELINTRFRVRLRIDNPNPFPVELSALRYELYGGGRFWADGTGKDILPIPPEEAAETDLSIVMNFIDMRRELLDEIIAMGQVRYRFTGESTVSTGVDYLPQFRTRFDRSGDAPVIE